MLQKSSKKTVPLPSRPEQPTVVEIIQDVKHATPDDIIFKYLKTENSECQSPDSNFSDSTFCFGDSSKLSLSPPTERDSLSDGSKESETESVYQKTVQFLQQTEELRDAPAKLKKECEDLEILSQELKSSIDVYKDQAQTLLDKTFDSKDE